MYFIKQMRFFSFFLFSVVTSLKFTPPTFSDVKYANLSESNVLDIYIPKTENPKGTLIFVHGGAFDFGTQKQTLILPSMERALIEGYIYVSIDYRKSNETHFPGHLGDVKSAVRFLKANKEKYGLKGNFTILGDSAGGYLALMTALTPEIEFLNGDNKENIEYDSLVDKLVVFYPVVDLLRMDEDAIQVGITPNFSEKDSFLSRFLGKPVQEDKNYTLQSYWKTYINKLHKVDAFVIVGSKDEVIPYLQSIHLSQDFYSVINDKEIRYRLIEGAGHADPKFYQKENLDLVFDFIKT